MATNTLSTIFAIQPAGLVPFDPASPDAAIIKAWNKRQTILAEIESRGRFYDVESHSETEGMAFDHITMLIDRLSAKTLEGVAIKLWVAAEHAGGQCFNDKDRSRQDALRRADVQEIACFIDELDFPQKGLIHTAFNLATIIQAKAA